MDGELQMSTREPWHPGETPDEQAARREAYERLAAAARRVGVSLDRLSDMLRQVTNNEAETRRFLADEVYGVPDSLLDDMVRVRLADLPQEDDPPA
jgi:8-oxo-dGTP pyrophosphatase MutT (NUDIX family)